MKGSFRYWKKYLNDKLKLNGDNNYELSTYIEENSITCFINWNYLFKNAKEEGETRMIEIRERVNEIKDKDYKLIKKICN